MLDLIIKPWQEMGSIGGLMLLMAVLIALPSAMLGAFLVVRKMAMTSDLVTHSAMPGLVIAFLFVGNLGSIWLNVGAVISALLAVFIAQWLATHRPIKSDTAIGMVLTSFFALGILILSAKASSVDLDPDCVLYGQLEQLVGANLIQIGDLTIARELLNFIGLYILVIIFVIANYRTLLVSSFDPDFAQSIWKRLSLLQYSLLAMVALIMVQAFQVVGAILMVSFLITPTATAILWVKRLPSVLIFASIYTALSCVIGFYFAYYINANTASFIAVVSFAGFVLSWLIKLMITKISIKKNRELTI